MSVTSVGSTASYATSVSVQVVQVKVEFLPPATQTNLSQAGTLLSRLEELSKSDPEKFKAAMSQVATALRDQAAKATGRQAQVLGLLADRFEATAKSGSLETLWKAPETAGAASGASTASGSTGATAATTGSAGGTSAASETSSASSSTASTASTSTASGAAASDQAAASAQAATTAATQKTDQSTTEVERKGRGHHRHHQRHGGRGHQDEGSGVAQGWTPGKLLSMVADVVRAALDTVLGAAKSTDATASASAAGQGTSSGSSASASTAA